MLTIEEIINGRELITWQDLSECLKASPRGRWVGFHTLQVWMVAQPYGIPCIREGLRLLFSWPEVWCWHKVHLHQGQAFPQCSATYGVGGSPTSENSP